MPFPLTAILQLINFTATCFFSLLINAVILLFHCFDLVLYIHFLSLTHYFLYLKTLLGPLYKWHWAESILCSFTTSIFHSVENYFPRLWGMGISDAIFKFCLQEVQTLHTYILVQ